MSIALSAARNDFNDGLWNGLKQALPAEEFVRWEGGEVTGAEEVEVLLAMGKLGSEQIAQCPKLALIQTLSDGYDAVDVDAATEAGVYVSFSPGDATGNAESVAEYAVMLMLASSRRLNAALSGMRDGGKAGKTVNPALVGKTVLIAGLGSIGELVAERLKPFGVVLKGVDRSPEKAPKDVPTRPLEELKEAVAEADYVVICLRGSKENTHLFGKELLAAMKEGGTLINVARGSLVDEEALYEAVKSGHLAAAGLDVLEHEPADPRNPLLTLPQIFVTPHIAGNTDINLAGTVKYVAEVISKFRADAPIASLLNEPKEPRKKLKKAQ